MRRRLPALLRLVAIACAVLAVAAPAAPVQRPADRTTVFVLDVSASVAPATLREAVSAIEAASAKERVGVIVFGAEAELLVPPQPPPLNLEARLLERFRAPDVERPDADRYAVEFRRPNPDFSNVRAAMALAASTGADCVVLMTDGRVEAVTADPVVPLRSDWSDDAIAVDLEAPPAVREGEAFDCVLRARAGRDVEATAVLTVDHEVVADDVPIRLRGGQDTLVTFRGLVGPDRQGLHTIRVYIRHDDPRPRNNRAAACVYVRSKPRALLIADDPLPFDMVLKGQGFEVERVGAARVAALGDELAEFDAIVVSLDDVTTLDAEPLARAVRDGAGLLVSANKSNASRAFPAALNELLPVTWAPRPDDPAPPKDDPKPPPSVAPKDVRFEAPPVSLLLLIDASGSMSGQNLELAKEACLATADTLTARDSIAVLGFNSRPFHVVRFTRAGDRRVIESEVLSLIANGYTDIAMGLAGAADEIHKRPESVRHVILLSDGLTPAADWETLLGNIKKAGITVTTVCVGVGAGFNAQLMSTIANETGGRFIFSADFKSVPKIFTNEARRVIKETDDSTAPPEDVQPPDDVEPPVNPNGSSNPSDPVETPRRVKARDPHEATRGIEAFPDVWGMIAAEPRFTARVALEGGTLPLLASWRVGLGEVAVWTSDFGGTWGRDWAGKPEAAQLIAQLVRSLARSTEGPEPRPTVTGPDAEGAFRFRIEAAGADVRAQALTPEPEPLALLPAGAGALEGTFNPPEANEPYRLRILEGERAALFGVIRAYPGELRITEADETYFVNVLELDALPTLFATPVPAREERPPLVGGFLVAAALLLLGDVLMRRLTERG